MYHMNRFLTILLFFFVTTHAVGQNKDTVGILNGQPYNISITGYRLIEGTTFSYRGTGTFRDMTSWNSNDYTQGYMVQGGGNAFRMNYRLLFPGSHQPNYEPGYPMIVMLHGAGERGNCWDQNCYWDTPNWNPNTNNPPAPAEANHQLLNNDHSMAHGGQPHLTARNQAQGKLPDDPTMHPRGFPGFVLFPQMLNQWRKSSDPTISELANAIRLIRLVCKKYNIDQDRIYVHGLSMGGQATLEALNMADWLFAAAAPMSALSYQNSLEYDSVKNIPIWFFQGGRDSNPKPSQTETMIRNLRQKGANIRYTLYPSLGHGTWNSAYAEPDFFSWLLSKRKSNIHVDFDNPNICGTTGAGARLELPQGFFAYQWERDGEIIPGATSHTYLATFPGTYRARFSRKSSNPTEAEWNRWSDPVTVGEKTPEAPVVEQIGTVVLGDLNNNRDAYLNAPEGFETYEWYRNGTLYTNFNELHVLDEPHKFMIDGCGATLNCTKSGAWTLVTKGFDGCPSLPSKPMYIIMGTHNTDQVPPAIVNRPTNLTAEIKSPTSVVLRWNDNSSDERAFEVWRRRYYNVQGENYNSGWVLAAFTEEDQTLFVDTGLEPGVTYWYKIRAVNNKGRSIYFPDNRTGANVNYHVYVTMPGETTPPTPPTNLFAEAAGVGTIRLSWQPSADASNIRQYRIYFDEDVFETNSADTVFVLSELPINTIFNFTVRAEDTGGNLSEPSNPSQAHTFVFGLYYKHSTGVWPNGGSGGFNLPSMDQSFENPEFTGWVPNFTLAEATQDDFFNFEFSGYLYLPSSGDYRFRINSDDGHRLYFNGEEIFVRNSNGQSTSSNESYNAGAYPIVVQMYEYTGGQSLTVQYSLNNGGWTTIPTSMLRSGTPPDLPVPPAAPSNLSANATGMQTIDLTWNGPAGPDLTFELQRSLDVNGPFNAVTSTDQYSFSDANLVPGTTYYYRVRTLSADTLSAFAAVANGTTFSDNAAPTQPGMPVESKISYSVVAFSWPASTDNIAIKEYDVYANNILIGTSPTNAFQAVDLAPGTDYDFHVVARDLNDNASPPSPVLEVTTLQGQSYFTRPEATVLNETSAWQNSDGDSPASFEHNGQIFYVQKSAPITSQWTVDGAASKVVIEDNVTVTVGNNPMYSKVEIPGNGVLNLNSNNNATFPELVSLSPTSTVNYSSKFIQPADYGNLAFTTSGAFTFSAGVTRVRGNLSVANNASLKGASSNGTTVELTGDLLVTGTPAALAPSFGVNLELVGNGNHTIQTGGTLDLYRIQKSGNGTITFNNNGSPATLNIGATSGGGLSLGSGATLSIGNNTLNLSGAASVNGNGETGRIALNEGTININSSSNLNSNLHFSPTTNTAHTLYQNMTGGGDVVVHSALDVSDGIKILRGELHSNGNIRLLSNATRTANLQQIENNGSVVGDMIVERYFSPKARSYRYIASPVAGTTVANWQQFFPITGNFQGTSQGAGLSTNPSMYIREPEGWVPYPEAPETNAAPVERGRGYAAFVRPTTEFTMAVTGEPNQGDINFSNVLFGAQGGELINDWNLLGNPYPSTIQWSNNPAQWTKSGWSDVVVVRNNSAVGVGQFQYYDAGTNLHLGMEDGRISPGQAFWVRATSANPTLIIHEAAKYAGQQTFYRESAPQVSHIKIRLTQNTLADEAAIVLTDYGTDAFDPQYDGSKMSNEGMFNLTSLSTNKVSLAINNMSDEFCSKTVPLEISSTPAGTYHLDVDSPETLYGVGQLRLIDYFVDSTMVIDAATRYTFTVTGDTASFGKYRFALVLDRPELQLNAAVEVSTACDQPAQVTLTNTQAGATYAIFRDNTAITDAVTSSGAPITFTLSDATLAEGVNELRVQTALKGCTSAFMPEKVSVTKYAQPTLTVTEEEVSVCAGSPATLKAVASGSATSYQWSTSAGVIKGANAAELVTEPVQFANYYYVRALTPEGCVGPKKVILVRPEHLSQPEIIQMGDTLVSEISNDSYIWSLNGQEIASTISENFLVAKDPGSYTLSFKQGGCYKTSREHVITSVEESSNGFFIHVFPNPATTKNFNLKVETPSQEAVLVKVVDILGRQFFQSVYEPVELREGVTLEPEHDLKAGVYFVLTEQGSRKAHLKVLVKE